MTTSQIDFNLRHGDPLKGATVPITKAPHGTLGLRNTPKRRAFLAANCDALADLLKRLPDENHDQGSFGFTSDHPCGTVACGMGWAALSHAFPGLQYRFETPDEPTFDGIRPIVNGKNVAWYEAGSKYFGAETFHYTFMDTSLSKAQLINRLIKHANDYRSES